MKTKLIGERFVYFATDDIYDVIEDEGVLCRCVNIKTKVVVHLNKTTVQRSLKIMEEKGIEL